MHTRTWKDYLLNDTAILVWMAVASIIFHCLVNNQYGFHRDELNFIEDGRHLAWDEPRLRPELDQVGPHPLRHFQEPLPGLAHAGLADGRADVLQVGGEASLKLGEDLLFRGEGHGIAAWYCWPSLQ